MKLRTIIAALALTVMSTTTQAAEPLWGRFDCEAFAEVARAASTSRKRGWEEERLIKLLQDVPGTSPLVPIFTRVIKFVYRMPEDQYENGDQTVWTECMEGYTEW